MSGSHRGTRRRKRQPSAGRGVVLAVLGILAIAAALVALPFVLHRDAPGTDAGAAPGTSSSAVAKVDRPEAGEPLTVKTPEGFTYSVEAVGRATSKDPMPAAPPAGLTNVYVDYILTNAGKQAALLDFPPDVFVKRSVVPDSDQERCIPRVGAPDDMCAAPSRPRILGRVGDSRSPYVTSSGDTYIPAGSSYLVRAVVGFVVPDGTSADDLGLYVWAVRFTGDRTAREVVFP